MASKISFNAEPVAIMGVLTAAISLITAFGFKLDPEQVGAITAFTSVVLSLFARKNTYAAKPLDEYLAAEQAKADEFA